MGGRGSSSMTAEQSMLAAVNQSIAELQDKVERPKRSRQAKTVSLDTFLAERRLAMPISDYTLDTTRLPHGETQRQKKAREAETLRRAREYSEQRQAAINEYEQLVKAGKIKKPSKVDELREVARGNPDNASVQAARRLLKKRGLSW